MAKVVAEIQAKGGKAEGFVLDTRNLAQVRHVHDHVIATGGLDILINNAGVVFGGPVTGEFLGWGTLALAACK
jgi:3-oxoacyl-[acyl-carrier protein] reductase